MGDGVRLFVGVPISVAAVAAITDGVSELRRTADSARVRWVDSACYHVTLKFIGWTRPEAIAAIRDEVAATAAQAAAIEVQHKGIGAFPAARRARIVWAGVTDPGGKLAAMARSLDERLARLGYPAETRAYHPHVTIGRIKAPADVSAAIDPLSDRMFSETSVDSICLYESFMKSSGSEYVVLASWPLRGGARGPKRHTRRVQSAKEEEDLHGDEQGQQGTPRPGTAEPEPG